MAERSVSVKLSARVDSYVAAMAQAKAATTGLAASGGRDLTRLGGQMQSFGRSATMGVTVPLLALGAGAVAMSAKFDTAFAQMVGLANVPASEVDGLKESVLALAGETAQAPQDLAEALYFAASAGLDSAEAMDAVELAARGAAAGMGSAQDIVGLTASAVASYGAANISAAEATDILTATIREGRAEPAELAATLGRVLPIASQMGITFAEVGGATAYLTNIMGGADISTTALRDALMKLSAPGQAAKDALVDMGTSFGELQSAISEDGLLGALELLRDHGFAGNAEALHALVPDAQGFLALTALLNDESGQLAGTIDAVTNSAGSLDMAFGAVSDTSGFKMKQAITDIKVAMIQAGDILLPIAASIASAIGDLAGWFSELDPAVKTVVVAFAGLAATVGPVVFIAGSFLKHLKEIKAVMPGLTGAAGKMGLALAGIGAAITIGFFAYQAFTKKQRELKERTDEVGAALILAQGDVFRYALQAEGAEGAVAGLAAAQAALSQALLTGEDGTKITQALGTLGLQASQASEVLIDLGANGEAALYRLAIAAGVPFDKAEQLAKVINESDDQMFIAAATAQILGDEYIGVGLAMEELQDQAEKTDLNAVAQQGLALAASSSEAADQMIRFIEGATGWTRTGPHAVDLFLMYGEALGAADQSTQELILATDESGASLDAMTTSTGGAAAAAGDLSMATAPLSEQVLVATNNLGEMSDATRLVGTDMLGAVGTVQQVADGLRDLSDSAALAATDMVDAVGEVQQVVSQLDKVGDAGRKSDEMFADLGDAASDAAGGFADLEQAVVDLWAAFDNIMNPADDLRAAARDVNATFEDMINSFDDAAIASTNAALAFDITTESGREQEEAYIAARDAIYEHAHQMMLNGASATEAAGDIAYNTEQLHDQMLAAGYSEEAIAALNGEYFLTPEQVTTLLKTIGEAQAAAEIAHHKTAIGEIPTTHTTRIDVVVDENDIGKVNSQLAGIVNQIRTAYIGASGPGAKSGGGAFSHALGAYIPRPEFAMLHGNEAVLPLSNPIRMRELIDDPRIGEPLLAALAGNMTPAASYGYQNAPSTATMERADLPPIYVYNNGREITPHDIARAIVEARAA